VIALALLAALFPGLWLTMYLSGPPLIRGVRSSAGRLAAWLRGRSRLGPLLGRLETWPSCLPLILSLVVGALIIAWAADTFTDIAGAVQHGNPTVQRIDAAVYEWFGSRRTPAATVLFVAITTVGGPGGMAAIAAGVVAILVARRRFRWAVYLGLNATGGALLNQLLKASYLRQRPDLKAAVMDALGYSFPSGHAMGATIVLGSLAYLAARSIRTWKDKSAALAALASLALAIGVSRLYLGVHWSSDVGAGFAAGLLWVTATTTGYEFLRQSRLGQAGRASRRDTRSE
jgi:undecaprenyl-diphosphatase